MWPWRQLATDSKPQDCLVKLEVTPHPSQLAAGDPSSNSAVSANFLPWELRPSQEVWEATIAHPPHWRPSPERGEAAQRPGSWFQGESVCLRPCCVHKIRGGIS